MTMFYVFRPEDFQLIPANGIISLYLCQRVENSFQVLKDDCSRLQFERIRKLSICNKGTIADNAKQTFLKLLYDASNMIHLSLRDTDLPVSPFKLFLTTKVAQKLVSLEICESVPVELFIQLGRSISFAAVLDQLWFAPNKNEKVYS